MASCLPIVDRELRVAARKSSTFWLRAAAAFTALVIGAGFLIIYEVQGTAGSQFGRALFYVLVWLAFAVAASMGLFLTSDCLSEEKREGTLGLLFLTELRGYDVVLGKLAATSLRGVYALLAVIPMLAITQIMGGVTAAQYWKSSLALVNALFVSLAAGVMVSALSRESQKSMAGTLLLLLLLTAGGPSLDATIAGAQNRAFSPGLSLASPAYLLAVADDLRSPAYGKALLANQIFGWAMLGVAALVVPRAWQDKKRAGGSIQGWRYAWKFGGASRRARLRRVLLTRDPMTWLICRERRQALAIWLAAVLILAGFGALFFLNQARDAWIVLNYVGGLFVLLLYLWAASQACRFLSEARRNGVLELLLVSPLDGREIVRGQWRAMARLFGLPVLLLLLAQGAGATMSQIAFQRVATQVNTAVSQAGTNSSVTITNQDGTTVVVGGAPSASQVQISTKPTSTWLSDDTLALRIVTAAGAALMATVTTLANLIAILWFGMWMAMTSRTATLATLKTITFVQVLPFLVISFATALASAMVMFRFFGMSGQPGSFLIWWPLVNAAAHASLCIAKDIGFAVWARNRLYASLRQAATRAPGQPQLRVATVPPSPIPPPVPPPIPA